MTREEQITHMKKLVLKMNQYRDEYYNQNAPSIPDSAYDRLFDELEVLEKRTGIILSGSPTQTVGYHPVSELPKVKHPIPLLSLDKTKLTRDILDFVQKGKGLTNLALKMDGLTVKLVYDGGELQQASTRGDGEIGEDITHNIPAFINVPLTVPYKDRLVITGEAHIRIDDFEKLRTSILDRNGEPYKTPRNLASGSVRTLNPAVCKERCVSFIPFNVLEGLDYEAVIGDSRSAKLSKLKDYGFGYCDSYTIDKSATEEQIETYIECLQTIAREKMIPIDGIVAVYDNISYSKSCGRTGRAYKDGLAFKFEDDTFETVFRSIEWTPTRSGQLAPVALFDTIEIDGCAVSRASLHNLTFIKDLELQPGCRILVSKRNMIIPHIEDNLDRGNSIYSFPGTCPSCGAPTRVHTRKGDKGRIIETLHCDNPDCETQWLRQLIHFAGKKAMDIKDLSTATLSKFQEYGWLDSFQDLYHLDMHREEIIRLEGFGVKSYENLWASIEASRHTTFERYLVAMDIPLVGRTISRSLGQQFHGSLDDFEQAATGTYDFTQLEDIGTIINDNIHTWFSDMDNLKLWKELQKEMTFEERTEETMNVEQSEQNPFAGRTIVATGKLMNYTRDGIQAKILSLGAKAGSSVSKNTDYLICGDKAGSKLAKAQSLGVRILSEYEFLSMIDEA